MRTAVDTNVLSALWSGEPTAAQMSALLSQSRRAGSVVICGVVYAELLSHPRASQGFVDGFLRSTHVQVDFDLDESIWRDAGRGFADHAARRRGSASTQAKRLLADSIVGAHAMHRADRLLTLDGARYAADFPTLHLVSAL